MRSTFFFMALLAATATALPTLEVRGNAAVNPNAVTGTKCTNKAVAIGDHNINVALLSICGGIAGKIESCGGAPQSTVGASGDAKFTLTAATKGQTINISKGRWEGCVRAARATCGDSPFTTTCIGGANGNKGNVQVVLAKA